VHAKPAASRRFIRLAIPDLSDFIPPFPPAAKTAAA
jgi:hypothetical protein